MIIPANGGSHRCARSFCFWPHCPLQPFAGRHTFIAVNDHHDRVATKSILQLTVSRQVRRIGWKQLGDLLLCLQRE
ncbi:MAG: hypothetical protein AAFP90_02255, partial [Planctomycetota bacterium]